MRPAARRRPSWWVVLGLSVAALAAALISQHVYDMQPCAWCVLQRLIFVGTALAAVLGLLWRAAPGQILSALALLALSLCGVAAALWQHLVAASSTTCNLSWAEKFMHSLRLDNSLPDVFEARASCADAAVSLLGLPYVAYSLALFVLFAMIGMRNLMRPAPR